MIAIDGFNLDRLPAMVWILAGAALALAVGVTWFAVWFRMSRQRALLDQARTRLTAELAERDQRIAELADAARETASRLEQQRGELGQAQQRIAQLTEQARGQAEALEAAHAEQQTLREAIEARSRELGTTRQTITELQTREAETRRATDLRIKELQESRESFRKDFEALANRIFDEKSQRLSADNQKQLGQILTPFKEQLGDFRKQVHEAYGQESQQRAVLKHELTQLQKLNQQLSDDATSLTKALKGQSKTRGDWGEMILTQVLEASGLVAGQQFETQVSLKTDDNKRIAPDAIVRLPDERDIVIDAKVSLNAHVRLMDAEDDAARAAALKDHVQAVRTHIRQLGGKAYHDAPGVRSLDFTVMFIPNEPAYIEALRADASLFRDALDAGIGLASPSTLLGILRVVENLWRTDKQTKNAQEIASRAGALYDKFVGFVTDLDKVGEQLDRASRSYADAHAKLATGPGNLARQAEMLKDLGAKTAKSLPTSAAQDELQSDAPD